MAKYKKGQGRHTPAVRKQQTGDQQESDSRTNRQTDRQTDGGQTEQANASRRAL